MRALWRDGTLVALVMFGAFAACAAAPKSATPKAPVVDVVPPKSAMSLEQARRYMLTLVNRDRAAAGLSQLVMDETASKAGQRHAEDMAKNGFTAHWGTDGSVPEQRYSEAGGSDFVQENAGCLGDGKVRSIDGTPRFEAAQLERVQRAFMDEKPPKDGHRRNVLKPVHTAFGVGIALPTGTGIACLSQEFVDDYGDYPALPKTAKRGATLHLEGEVKGPVVFGGVGIGRIDLAQPMSAALLNTTYTYAIPQPKDLYFPKGFVTKKPVKVDGKHFEVDVPLGTEPGRYGVSIWAKFPGAGQQLDMVSLRIVTVQ